MEPHVNPSPGYAPLPPDERFTIAATAPGPGGDFMLVALACLFLWVVYCAR